MKNLLQIRFTRLIALMLLGGFHISATQARSEPVGNATTTNAPAQKKQAKDTANAVNQVPGVSVKASDLETKEQIPPIKGFHPVKKLLRPVENLGNMSITLEQKIMQLSGPVAALQPPMQKLDHKMTNVHDQIVQMVGVVADMQKQIAGALGSGWIEQRARRV